MTVNDLHKLCRFYLRMDLEMFYKIFDDRSLAEHLWKKYVNVYERDFLAFFQSGIDSDCCEQIVNYISSYEETKHQNPNR